MQTASFPNFAWSQRGFCTFVSLQVACFLSCFANVDKGNAVSEMLLSPTYKIKLVVL